MVNGWKPLTIITKRSILNVEAALDTPLHLVYYLISQKVMVCKVDGLQHRY